MPMALHLSGQLDVAALRSALLWILTRHEAVRVVFADRGGALTQAAQPVEAVPWRVADLSGEPPQARAARLMELGAAEAARPFDLAHEPVTRLLLVRLDDAEHVLVVNVHHIAFDGWSAALLLEELAACYPAALAGRPDPVPSTTRGFGDYARRQRAALLEPRVRDQLAYWVRRLADPPAAITWPGAGCTPSRRHAEGDGDVCWRLLPPSLVAGSQELARRLRATPFMVLLAAYLALLRAWTGSAELCVGVPFAGRRNTVDERLLGFFVNTIALRLTVPDDLSLRDLVGAVRGCLLEAHRNQDVPFGVVLEHLAPAVPPFQTMFILQNEMRVPPAWGDIVVRQTMLATGWAKYDLTVALEAREQTLAVDAEHRPACMDTGAAAHLLGAYAGVLRLALSDPSRPAADLGAEAIVDPVDLTPPPRPPATSAAELFRGPVADWRTGGRRAR